MIEIEDIAAYLWIGSLIVAIISATANFWPGTIGAVNLLFWAWYFLNKQEEI